MDPVFEAVGEALLKGEEVRIVDPGRSRQGPARPCRAQSADR